MSETSALMDTLRQEGVSPDLLRAVEEYRTAHPLAEACLLYTSDAADE